MFARTRTLGHGAGLRRELGPFGLMVHADYAFGDVKDRTLSYGYTRLGGGASLMLPIAGYRTLLEGGLDLGGGWNSQALRDGRRFETGDFTGGAVLRLSRPFGPVRAALDLFGGARLMKVNDSLGTRPAAGATLVILYGLQ